MIAQVDRLVLVAHFVAEIFQTVYSLVLFTRRVVETALLNPH